jgi:4-amino-4-deoxy-L-arabinose transferase-like glycosyltransferase
VQVIGRQVRLFHRERTWNVAVPIAAQNDSNNPHWRTLFWISPAAAGIAARLLLLLLAGSKPTGKLSGGGDAHAYITLGESLFEGHGLTYSGQPTAFRAPLYPILLAAAHWIFGAHYLFFIRLLQFAAGIAAAYICSKAARQIWGKSAGRIAFAVALCFPTLVFFTSEILTEEIVAFLTALFLYFLVREHFPANHSEVGMGISSGLSMLFRFNAAFLPIFALWPTLRYKPLRTGLRRATTLCVVSGIVIAPWLIRNLIVFHGQVLYSTHTGANLLEGIIAPEGRGQPGEMEAIHGKLGWVWQEMETNGPERLALPSEFELNRHALPIALQAWRDAGISALWVICKKLGYFWISTDQLIDTLLFPPWQRALRIIGVLMYWLALLLAVHAWFALRKTHPNLATTLLVYVVVTTILHFPFVMNTRLRVPLIDPLLCILAGHLGSTPDAP